MTEQVDETNSKLFADDMIEPVQKWLDDGADPAFISAALRQFADIIDRKAQAARTGGDA